METEISRLFSSNITFSANFSPYFASDFVWDQGDPRRPLQMEMLLVQLGREREDPNLQDLTEFPVQLPEQGFQILLAELSIIWAYCICTH